MPGRRSRDFQKARMRGQRRPHPGQKRKARSIRSRHAQAKGRRAPDVWGLRVSCRFPSRLFRRLPESLRRLWGRGKRMSREGELGIGRRVPFPSAGGVRQRRRPGREAGGNAVSCGERKARKKGRCVPPLRNRKRKDSISPRAFSTPRKGCRRVWSRDWAGIPARTRPRCPQAGRSPRRRSLRGFPGRCRRKWRTFPRQ